MIIRLSGDTAGSRCTVTEADFLAGNYPIITNILFDGSNDGTGLPLQPSGGGQTGAEFAQLLEDAINENLTNIFASLTNMQNATFEPITVTYSVIGADSVFTVSPLIVKNTDYLTVYNGYYAPFQIDYTQALATPATVLFQKVEAKEYKGSNYGSSVNDFPGSTFAGRV